jgi:carboxyl-terminal processing protease
VAADTYRQLSLFGDVFERVRADYVEKPDDSKLIESAINGMLGRAPRKKIIIANGLYFLRRST